MSTGNNESTPMKTTLNLLLLALAILLPAVSFAGLVGILPPTVFVGTEAALFAFTFVGLLLVAVNDDGKGCRPVIVHRTPAARPTVVARPVRYSPVAGLRRRECAAV